jgi:hypothetical protein
MLRKPILSVLLLLAIARDSIQMYPVTVEIDLVFLRNDT